MSIVVPPVFDLTNINASLRAVRDSNGECKVYQESKFDHFQRIGKRFKPGLKA